MAVTTQPTEITTWAIDPFALRVEQTLQEQTFGWTTSNNTITGIPVKPNLQSQNAFMYAVHLWQLWSEENIVATDTDLNDNTGTGKVVRADAPTLTGTTAMENFTGTMTGGSINGGVVTITALNADQITQGTITGTGAMVRASGGSFGGTFSGAHSSGSVAGGIVGTGISATNVTTGTMSGTLVGTGISATNITTGTMSAVRIDNNINASQITGNVTGTAQIVKSNDPDIFSPQFSGFLDATASGCKLKIGPLDFLDDEVVSITGIVDQYGLVIRSDGAAGEQLGLKVMAGTSTGSDVCAIFSDDSDNTLLEILGNQDINVPQVLADSGTETFSGGHRGSNTYWLGIDATTGKLKAVDSAISARRFKRNFRESELNPMSAIIMGGMIEKYQYKEGFSDDDEKWHHGMIADDVAEMEKNGHVLPNLVIRKDGKVNSLEYHALPVLMLSSLHYLNSRIDEILEGKLT